MTMNLKVVVLEFLMLICYNYINVESQIGYANLTNVGVVPGKDYALKITGPPANQLLVIKLVPNVNNLTSCVQPAIEKYKKMLNRIIVPISEALNRTRSAVTDKPINTPDGENFWGAVVGGIALGVASAAQITAGVALHNSIKNAQDIYLAREAIRETAAAIGQIQTSQQRTITAISALQDQVNSHIVPVLESLGCEQAKISLSLDLTRYFSEISLIFGPNLQNPSMTTLTIQAISRAFNDDFSSLLISLGYTNSDVLDILESDSIRARIIDVSTMDYYIALQIEYPAMTQIADARVQEFNVITHTQNNEEWIVLFPEFVLIRGSLISSIDVSGCSKTSQSLICDKDRSIPMGQELELCVRGTVEKCTRTRVGNSHAPRYTLSAGVIFANCFHIHCRCIVPEFRINHDPKLANIMISSDFCSEVLIDSIYVIVGPRMLNRTTFAYQNDALQPVQVTPIDINNEIVSIQESVNVSKEHLKNVENILKHINPNLASTTSLSLVITSICVLTGLFFVLMIWLCYVTKKIWLQEDERKHLMTFANPGLAKINTYGSWDNTARSLDPSSGRLHATDHAVQS